MLSGASRRSRASRRGQRPSDAGRVVGRRRRPGRADGGVAGGARRAPGHRGRAGRPRSAAWRPASRSPGIRVDHGSHRLHPSTAARPPRRRSAGCWATTCRWRPRNGRIRLADRWVAFPLSARRPRPHAAAVVRRSRAARDAAASRRCGGRAGRHLRRRRPGRARARRCSTRFYGPYARKLWGLEPERADRRAGPPPGQRRGPGRRAAPACCRPASPARRASCTRAGASARSSSGWPRPPPPPGPTSGWAAEVERARPGRRRRDGARLDGSAVRRRRPRLVDGAAARRWPATRSAARRRRCWTPPAASTTGRWCSSTSCSTATACTPFDAHYFPGPRTCALARAVRAEELPRRPRPGRATAPCSAPRCRARRATHCGAEPTTTSAPRSPTASSPGPAGRPTPVAVEVRAAAPRLPRLPARLRAGPVGASTGGSTGRPALVTFGRQGLFAHDNTHHALAMGGRPPTAWAPTARSTRRAGRAARARFRDSRGGGLMDRGCGRAMLGVGGL